jgi:hypothetical protein
MIIIDFIFFGGILFSLWILYCVIEYKFGKKIREYLFNKKELREANNLIQEHKNKKALKFKKEQERKRKEPEYIQAEEVERSDPPIHTSPRSWSWEVYNKNETKLLLSPKK